MHRITHPKFDFVGHIAPHEVWKSPEEITVTTNLHTPFNELTTNPEISKLILKPNQLYIPEVLHIVLDIKVRNLYHFSTSYTNLQLFTMDMEDLCLFPPDDNIEDFQTGCEVGYIKEYSPRGYDHWLTLSPNQETLNAINDLYTDGGPE